MRNVLRHRPITLAVAGLALAVFTLVGCDVSGTSSNEDVGNVAVGFGTTTAPQSEPSVEPKAEGDSIVLSGSNGTLTIDDVRLIVSELELEGDADSSEFEAPPSFLDLPLDSTEITPVAAGQVPTGSYTEFEFEVEDVDLEEADEDDEEVLADLAETIRSEFSNWPDAASMVITGSFTPEGDTAREFRTYFDAEVEVERELSPALEVTDNNLSRSLTVRLDPSQWFHNSDGTVRNLARDDYEATGELVEFEAEFEDGVAEIESDDDDDDSDDDDGDDD